MDKLQNIRHGDMALIGIKELPKGLAASDTKALMKGSHGNDHGFEGGVFYPKQNGDNLVGYFVAKRGCKLLHPEHGEGDGAGLCIAKIKAGVYEVHHQTEQTHEGLRPVID
jgi:hypothetical protein